MSPAGPATSSGTHRPGAGRPRSGLPCGIQVRPSGEVHDPTDAEKVWHMRQSFGPALVVRATRAVRTSATPMMSRPGQNVVEVLKGTGSQRAPAREVHTGVAVDPPEGSQPTARNPPRQRSTERTRLSGSSEASRRQWIPPVSYTH